MIEFKKRTENDLARINYTIEVNDTQNDCWCEEVEYQILITNVL